MVLLGVHVDKWSEATKIAKEKGIKFPITNDKAGKSSAAYGIEYLPTLFVLDKKGKIRSVDPQDLDGTVKKLLAEK